MPATWRALPSGPTDGGDALGDDQVGTTYTVRYTHIRYPHHPRPQITVVFGACYESANREYYVAADIEAQLTDPGGEVMRETTLDSDGLFPLAYPNLTEADADARNTAERWQRRTWSDADFWDGTETNFPT